jgi:hypothetical protein
MRSHVFYILLFLLSACGEDKAIRKDRVMEIKDLGELSTIEYTIGKLIQMDQSDSDWYKWGDRKLLINTRATVKAGVDLKKLREDDIKIKGNTVEITLPAAEYTSFSMDPNYTRTEVESISGFRDGFTQKEKNNFMKQGEEAIKRDLVELNILEEARVNAEDIVRDFYHSLGFEKVIVNSKEDK